MTTATVDQAPAKKTRRTPRKREPVSVALDTAALREAVKAATRASGKGHWGVLRLEAKRGSITVTGYNGEVSLSRTAKLSGGRGSFVVFLSGSLLNKVVDVCPDASVGLKVDDSHVDVTSGDASWRLKVAGEQFLVLEPPAVDGQTVLAVELAQSINRAVHATSADDARPILTGIKVDTDGLLVATDSYTMGIAASSLGFLDGALIPAPAAREVVRLAADGDDEVEVRWNHELVSFATSKTQIAARVITGEFPPWRGLDPHLAPPAVVHSVTVDRLAVLGAVKVVSVMAWAAEPVRLRVVDGMLELSMVNSELGDSDHPLAAEVLGEWPELALNPALLTRSLSALDGDLVTLQAVDGLKPVLIHDGRPDEVRIVQMPVRVS